MTNYNISKDHPIFKLANKIYAKSDFTDEELQQVFELDLLMQPTELIVSAGEKRQVAPYEMNDYFMSMKVTVGETFKTVVSRVMAEPTFEKKIARYDQLKSVLASLIANKYNKLENYLRDNIHSQQIEDKITPK